jgi:mannose-6-phosphate isomerase-like protein (cupin superfamily)
MEHETCPAEQAQPTDGRGRPSIQTGRPLVDGTPTDGPTLELTPGSTACDRLRQSPRPLVSDPVSRTWATLLERPAAGDTDRPVLVQWVSPTSPEPPAHHHPKTETFRALEGTLTVVREGEAIDLSPGDSLTVEPGQAHTFRNESDAVVAFEAELPSMRTVRGLYTAWGLAHERGSDENGDYAGPGPLQSLVVAADLFDETVLTMVPVPLQRLLWAAVGRAAQVSGVTGIDDAYLDASFWQRHVEQPVWGAEDVAY